MTFTLGGTFNQSQFDRLVAFVQLQKTTIADRLRHLYAELDRLGTLSFGYDADGVPLGYATVKPPDSYIAKLVSAYEVLGGDAEFDLKVRSMNQPVFLIRADEATSAQRLSNGEILRQPGLADAYTAELTRQLQSWLSETMQYRRNALELWIMQTRSRRRLTSSTLSFLVPRQRVLSTG
jgi:hypothetical protein